MIRKEGLNTEVKYSTIVKDENGYSVVEFDKDGIKLEIYSIDEILDPFIDKKYTKIKIEYSKDL